MLTVGTDTYITAEQADEFIDGLLLSTDAQRVAWAALSQANKEVYLRQAMLRIEAQIFAGCPADRNQLLKFPRYGQIAVPAAIKQAQALEACAAIGLSAEAAKRAQLMAMGITSFSAGKLSETYGHISPNALYSLQAAQLLRRYLAGGVQLG